MWLVIAILDYAGLDFMSLKHEGCVSFTFESLVLS